MGVEAIGGVDKEVDGVAALGSLGRAPAGVGVVPFAGDPFAAAGLAGLACATRVYCFRGEDEKKREV